MEEKRSRQGKRVWVMAFLLLGIMTGFVLSAEARGDRGGGLSLRTEFDNGAMLLGTAEQRYLEILVTAPTSEEYAVRSRGRLPLNIALVIDTSGSMAQEDKLEKVKVAALSAIGSLQAGDWFSLIAYDDRAKVLIPAEPVEGLIAARTLIAKLSPNGGTNLGAGLVEGYAQVRRHASSRTINRVLLLSDGKANVGLTDPGRLVQLAIGEAEQGISLSTFGVGFEFNEDLMAALGESGRGMYYYIDKTERITEIIGREFRGVARVVANDIRISVEIRNDLRIDKVFANTFEVQGNRVEIMAGDLSAGELRRIQIRLEAPNLAQGAYRVGTVRMQYIPAGEKESLAREDEIVLQYLRSADEVSQRRNREVTERSSIFEAHYARDEAAAAIDRNDPDRAQTILSVMAEKIRKAGGTSSRLQKELDSIEAYGKDLRRSLSREERSHLQKAVKFRKQAVEGC